MTNGTTPTENGSAASPELASDAALIAAITTDSPTEAAASSDPAAADEPKPPSFDDLPNLHPDVKLALDDMGYFAPTPVQKAVFVPVSEGKDLLVQSRTGTGKTTAFGLPLVNRIVPAVRQPQALILCPTRELALQVARELGQLSKHRGVIIEAVYGGAPIGKQINALKDGVHIIVGTPGRVLDHIGRRTLDCKTIQTFVLDECDEMLSMGFLEDIERVTSFLPEKHQTLLFSATMPVEVERYSKRHMKTAEHLSLSRDSQTVSDIHHAYYIVSGIARSRDLLKIIFAENPESAIIFCNMRDETNMVARFLKKQGLDAEPLSSDLSQADRERVMGRMKAKNLRFLCATDVAARGIDISNLSHVINFSVPESPEVYVHRTGRTGRAGKKGVAISMVGPRELGNFRFIRLQFGIKPEERSLPKDDIFEGKLKVPLPPIGTPQAPDPVQILIRGVQGTASDLETQIFEKLLRTASGKRVLAQLVADKLNAITTRTQGPRPRREREDERGGDGERSFDRGDRGGRFDRDRGERGGRFERDRGERSERPEGERTFDRDRGRDRGERGERPEGERAFDRDRGRDRGERSERPEAERTFDRDRGRDRGERSERPEGERTFDRDRGRGRGERTERPEGERTFDRDRGRDRGERTERPEGERTFDRDRGRDRGERTERPDGERGERSFDRGDRGGRFDRDRGERRERRERHERNDTIPVVDTTMTEAVTTAEAPAPVTDTTAEAPAQTERPERSFDRDRGERRFDRDRGERHRGRDRGERGERGDRGERPDRGERTEVAQATELVTAGSPALADTLTDTSHAATKVDDVAARALERGGDRKRDKKRSEPTEATREFWETWADNKSSKAPEPAPVKAEAPAETTSSDEARDGGDEGGEKRSSRGRGGKDRGRERAGRKDGKDGKDAKKSDRSEKAEKSDRKADKAEVKAEPAGRAKRDTVVTPAAEGSQARLFVSLGKKHGVSADDLRTLLAGPIGGDTARIGSVSLRDSHAHVRVPEELVDQIISGVHGTQHNDHDVTVERSRA